MNDKKEFFDELSKSFFDDCDETPFMKACAQRDAATARAEKTERLLLLASEDASNANKRLNDQLVKAKSQLKEIARVARDHDTGERQYDMTDWDYVMKLCEDYLK